MRTLRWVVTGVRVLELRLDADVVMFGADLALAGGVVGMADNA